LCLGGFEAVEAVGEGEEEGFGGNFEGKEGFSDEVATTGQA